MSNVPPTPFYLKVQLNLTINPYKILDDLFDAAKLIENEMTKFENNFIKDLGPITPKNFHSLDNTLKSALNIVNKELKDATDSSQKLIDNKYLNKVYPVTITAYIPIEPTG
jgi:flagellar hook-basal body complex protein FliE